MDGRLWTPIIARGGRGDRGVLLEAVPLDVSFNLTGVWRIPAWNRIGVEEYMRKCKQENGLQTLSKARKLECK